MLISIWLAFILKVFFSFFKSPYKNEEGNVVKGAWLLKSVLKFLK
jgi:hypothetical protein